MSILYFYFNDHTFMLPLINGSFPKVLFEYFQLANTPVHKQIHLYVLKVGPIRAVIHNVKPCGLLGKIEKLFKKNMDLGRSQYEQSCKGKTHIAINN